MLAVGKFSALGETSRNELVSAAPAQMEKLRAVEEEGLVQGYSAKQC